MELREARLPEDLDSIRRLWLDYLAWINDSMIAEHGIAIHDPVHAVEQDVAKVAQFHPPDGRMLLAEHAGRVCGIGCLRRIGAEIAEIKRMYVDPSVRGGGAGRTLLHALIDAARAGGFARVRLDSLDFMTTAHGIYRRLGFVDIPAYPESDIPEKFRSFAVFMELDLERHPTF